MSDLATPLRIGRQVLRNRIVAAPMERNYCTPDGVPTDHYVHHLAGLAAGGSALVFTEASYVRADGRARTRQMAVDDDVAVPGLRRIARAVHEQGALLGVQLVHAGRLARSAVSGYVPVAPSPVVAEVVQGDLPDELDTDDIADLVECFADATRRCAEAGVDVVSVHAAHGYLLSQFLSPRTNLRTDAYGDPAVVLREVIGSVLDAAATTPLAVGMRVSAFEGVDDGIDAPSTLEILHRAGAERLDFVDVSAGCYEAGEWITPTGELPRGLHAATAETFRALGRPVGVAGRIADARTAESIVAGGQADFVSLGRALHADPQWPHAVLSGIAPRPCIACNYCADHLRSGGPVGCAVNPDVHDVVTVRRAPLAAVLVVGAGPSGLEAARRLAAAGARVRLVDEQPAVGGMLAMAGRLHEYPEYREIGRWFDDELRALGVQIATGVRLAPEDIAAAPERHVVLATGGVPVLPPIPGHDSAHVWTVADWLRGPLTTGAGAHHVVWGLDRDAVAVADDLAVRGAAVTLVGAHHELAESVGPRARLLPLRRLTANPLVRVVTGASVRGIGPDHVDVERSGTHLRIDHVDRVVVALDGTDGSAFTRAARRAAPGTTFWPAGDAAGRGGWSATAMRDGAEVAAAVADALAVAQHPEEFERSGT